MNMCIPTKNFDSSDPLKTKSLLDSFCYFKGRRYHNLADVTYLLPNDDIEAKRLNLQHNLFKFIWKNNYSSPIHELLKFGKAKVLDIGCGTGQWILDMAKDYPQATFVGIDMSPIFPDVKDTPSNVVFLQLNLNDGIPFPNETFDFVFQRLLCSYVIFEKWKFYVNEMIRVTKPGGWLEFFEFNMDHQSIVQGTSSYYDQLGELIYSAFKAKGINPVPESYVPQLLEKCQYLSDVHCEEANTPVGDWAGQLGAMMEKYIAMNFETYRLLLSSSWGIDDESYDLVAKSAGLEFNNYRVYTKSFRWFSKKN